ncbi:hypothetical protein [Kitasatospora sp. NPDC050543]|uniref:hypothetical protein n=1 Tax=Kitasatospora sp. NPDC050543 TaxID=3364054 RepID=UPI0037A51211
MAERAAALTGPQRREVLASDRVTGEVRGTAGIRTALVGKGLAAVHGRVRATYLTADGLAVRDWLRSRSAGGPSVEAPAAEPGAFVAATGEGEAGSPEDQAERTVAVARAWAGLVEVRRLAGGGSGGGGLPAPWELARPVWAVALALEAAGLPPSAADRTGRRTRTGYRVTESGQAGEVRVEWRGPSAGEARLEAEARLSECARRLSERGWAALRYQGPQHTRFLLVSARR